MILYLLPGVGCDRRLFSRLQLPGMEVNVLEWPAFPPGCTIGDLAEVMQEGVDKARPHVLAGVSLGGMVAQELALLTRPEKVLLISTWTGPREWPPRVRLAHALGLPALIRPATMCVTWPVKRILGPRPRDIDKLLWDMAVDQGAHQIRRGVEAVLRWKGSTWKGPVYRIHGDNDHVIPLRFAADRIVPDGGHIMVLTKADEVSQALVEAVGG
ncbi:MAG: alpha/beta hydrolase [Flavobacteriales bacterium]|nr:alpha/beta hydrolase [Flavobacteriales bacterium]